MRHQGAGLVSVLVGLAAVGMGISPGCDDCPTREVGHVYGDFIGLSVTGQDHYPSQPDPEVIPGYVTQEGAYTWDCHLTMVMSPRNIYDVCWGGMGIGISPPFCLEDDLATYCAHLKMYQFIAGPKMKGEVYQVQHSEERYALPSPTPAAVYLRWEEYGWGFPDYQSVSVSGTATVLSESPFQLDYDVVFLDEAGNRREVSVLFEPHYYTYCDND